MSLPEVLLWNQLKQNKIGFTIRRQHPFDNYILDFYCPELMVDIEVDGAIHELKRDSDENRDAWLTSKEIQILRIPAREILKSPFDVAQRIQIYLEEIRDSTR